MIAAHLVQLIEIHADRLTNEVARALVVNVRTAGFRRVRGEELERRIFEILHHLGAWLEHPKGERVRAEFSDWGRRRFEEGIPLSEIVYAVLLLKATLRRYIRDNGLVEEAVPRMHGEGVLPVHMHGLMELNSQVNEFFDEAIYHLCTGYETAAKHTGVAQRQGA